MSRGLIRIGTSDSLPEARGEIVERADQERLEKVDREQDDHRRQVESHRDRRESESVADRTQHRLGHTDNEAHDRVVRRSEEHTSELQSPCNLVCRRLVEKNKRYTRSQ